MSSRLIIGLTIVAAVSIAMPFLLGAMLGLWMYSQVAADVDRVGFV
ncbi:MAG: hypothetical protein KDB03_09550 [Planctomycetales bacterium]|nr:hypothetical protein [Planctomycetales bacterium]